MHIQHSSLAWLRWSALALVLAWMVWLSLGLALADRPAVSFANTRGLYVAQTAAESYHWTSNRVDIPLETASGPTLMQLAFGPSRWKERAEPSITLADQRGALVTFPAPDQLRRYTIVLAPRTPALIIRAPVAQVPDDPRWLGVTLYDLAAKTYGVPLGALYQALFPTLALVLAVGALWCSARRGYGVLATLVLAALLPRVLLLDLTPPGFRPDEAVSLVDAWNIARTGHDHLRHLLPLGAQEAFGDWISPLLTYLELPIIGIVGPQPLAARLVTAVCGTLTIPVVRVGA